jgi:hypothetical protein
MMIQNTSLHSRGIAFLGTYVPQHCGIATFTHDLSTAVIQQASSSKSGVTTRSTTREPPISST